MSTTTSKRTYAQALEDAEAFRALFPRECYARWEFAGSLRRRKAEVGDVEHVIIPNIGEIPGGGLFAEPQKANLLWHCLDAMLSGRQVDKHLYGSTESGAPLYRWGEKYRGVDFRGFNHELFTADERNWGAQLLIRTGPADYSRDVVDTFNRRGFYRQQDGCLRTGDGSIVPVPDEQTYLKLAGLPWREPVARA